MSQTTQPARGRYDLAVVGAGAAGLMAAIQAGRTKPGLSIVALDGARTLGAKILVAGGGRCNVTHFEVGADDFCGGSRAAIAKVLRQLSVPETRAFFAELGVELVREPTGKLFPSTNRARTVLDALLSAAAAARIELAHPCRVATLERCGDGFQIGGDWGRLTATRVILATGGKALPRTGSDGVGYTLARALGHSIVSPFPALVPLTLPPGHHFLALSGVSCPARLEVREASGRRLASHHGSLLLTHFGLSGPVALDISRHLLEARADSSSAQLVASLLPSIDLRSFEVELSALGGRTVQGWLAENLPDRLAQALTDMAGIQQPLRGAHLSRVQRRQLASVCLEQALPVDGDRGFEKAEATAGGVPLTEVRLETMESRLSPGLHLCGEILDVDGRIGGFNFQWAWSSGTSAGRGAAAALGCR